MWNDGNWKNHVFMCDTDFLFEMLKKFSGVTKFDERFYDYFEFSTTLRIIYEKCEIYDEKIFKFLTAINKQ